MIISPSTAKKATARRTRAKPSTIFGRHQSMPQRINTTLKLHGVMEAENYKNSRAIISSEGEESDTYQVGEQISPALKLQRVYDDRVILSRNGVLETLYLDWGEVDKSTTSQETTASVKTPTRPSTIRPYGEDFIPSLEDIPEKYQERIRELRERGGFRYPGYGPNRGKDGKFNFDVEKLRDINKFGAEYAN